MIEKKPKLRFLTLLIIALNFSVLVLMTQNSLAKIESPINNRPIATGYYYSHWNQTMNVGLDGSLLIREEMTFNLDSGSYGFAYRDLNWDGFHDVVTWSIESASGTPGITYYSLDKEVGIIHFYWEWSRLSVPDNTEFTFILTYNVSSALDLRGERDRVYWNVIGGEFEVPINDITTTVIFPSLFNSSDIRSTTYYQDGTGDTEGTVTEIDGKSAVVFHQNHVAAYEAYTVDADSPPSGIEMFFSWRVYLSNNWIIALLVGFVPVFLFFILAFLIKGLDPRAKTIPTLNEVMIKSCPQCGFRDLKKINYCPQCGAEMKDVSEVGPPNDLTPAEVGTLLDEKFDKIDFIAEIFYLAEQGYLKIVQMPDNDEIYFQRTDKESYFGSLSKFDKNLLNFIASRSSDTIWFADKEKNKEIAVSVTSLTTIKYNISSLWKYKTDVYNRLSGGDNRYFESNPEKIRSLYYGMAIASAFLIGGLIFIASSLFYINNFIAGIIGAVVASFIGLLLSYRMPKLTKEGAKSKASWQSYLQLIRGEMTGFPDPYDQFSYSMKHFSYLLIDPKFDLPKHLKHISKQVSSIPPPDNYYYVTPYWYYYPGIYMPIRGRTGRAISGFDSLGRGFESIVHGISNIAESLPAAISNLAEGLTTAISNMSESFTPPSSSGGSSGFGGGFSGGGGGGGGGGIG
ncbi:MAG: DUF2207 domain-containing protein [Asgard group archaeon]|nr:DUF2207 domain-containing protein [Asgard group archaeon]